MTHVLIVERDRFLRDLYTSALEEDGYRVTSACDYADARVENLLHHPDVIIMDPASDRDGIEVAYELTRANQKVALIFNTPNPSRIGSNNFSAWVADALAPKSEDTSALLRTLHRLPCSSRSS